MRTRRTLALLFVAAALVALPTVSAQAIVIVGCTGTPSTDGSNLLSIYSGTSAPEVVQPSPCDYDLGTSTLTMKNGVDLVGLSRNTTLIRSQNNTAGQGTITVPANTDVEIRNVNIQTDSTNAVGIDNSSSKLVIDADVIEAFGEENATAIFTDGRMRGLDLLLRVDVDGEEVSGLGIGIDDDGSSSVFSQTLITVSGQVCEDGFGIVLDDSDANLEEVSIFVDCQTAIGIDISGNSVIPRLNNVDVFADGGSGGDTTGIVNTTTSSTVLLSDSRIEADGAGTTYGIHQNSSSSSFQLFNVTSIAGTGTTKTGLQHSAGLVNVDRSTLDGGSGNAFVVSSGATGRFGASKLIGSRGTAGTTTCVGDYDGSYAAIGSTTC